MLNHQSSRHFLLIDELPFYRIVQTAVYQNLGVVVHKIFLFAVAFCHAAGYYRQRREKEGASFVAAGAGFPAICEEKSGLCQRGTPQGVAFESNRQLLQKIMALGLAA